MYNKVIIEKVRTASRLEDVAAKYFPLKRNGDYYAALCPFHPETKPSFSISANKQLYNCFGCAEGGDVITFIMKMEGIDFKSAVEWLAADSGIQVEDFNTEEELKVMKRNKKIVEANAIAADYYHDLLFSKEDKTAYDYIMGRGITKGTIKAFKLGYAPYNNLLIKHLYEHGVSKEIMLASSLAREDNGNVFPMFRNRLMFPIFDERGNIKGMSGRTLDDKQSPKYINIAGNDVFKKKEILFGLYQAKKHIRDHQKTIITEGPMDVISCYQHGIKNVVAPQGTALTYQHVYKIKHWANDVIFCFDADRAGQEAIYKSMKNVLKYEMNGKVCGLPKDKDPADILNEDPKLFNKYLDRSSSVLEWRIKYVIKKYAYLKDNVAIKNRVVMDIADLLSNIPNDILRHEMIRITSARIDIPTKIIHNQIQRIERTGTNISNYTEAVKAPSQLEIILKEVLHMAIKYPKMRDAIRENLKLFKNANYLYGLLCGFLGKYGCNVHLAITESEGENAKVLSELELVDMQAQNVKEYFNELCDKMKFLKLTKLHEKLTGKIKNDIIESGKADAEDKAKLMKVKKMLKIRRANNDRK